MPAFQRFAQFMLTRDRDHDEEREPVDVVLERQVAGSALSLQFVVVLALSSLIASLGLLADSAVTVIGAMLIAPLMKPILALTYGLVIADRGLVLRAALTTGLGILVTLLVAAAVERVFELREPTDQILDRTTPTLIDLGVAVAAGIAATLAVTRANVADALPGVAVAVALVPPLCVSGVALSIGAWPIAAGAALLFAVNLFAIILCAGVVFLLDGYGSWRRAWPSLLAVTLCVCGLSVSLTHSLMQLVVQDHAQETIEDYLQEQFQQNRVVHPSDLRLVRTRLLDDHVFVFAEIEAPAKMFTAEQVGELHRRIAGRVDLPLNLKIKFVLTEEIDVYPYRSLNGEKPIYGARERIPRR